MQVNNFHYVAKLAASWFKITLHIAQVIDVPEMSMTTCAQGQCLECVRSSC